MWYLVVEALNTKKRPLMQSVIFGEMQKAKDDKELVDSKLSPSSFLFCNHMGAIFWHQAVLIIFIFTSTILFIMLYVQFIFTKPYLLTNLMQTLCAMKSF